MPPPEFAHLTPQQRADVATTRSGRRVLLVDRRRFPRDKGCGDIIRETVEPSQLFSARGVVRALFA